MQWQQAKALCDRGFYVIPLCRNAKIPLLKGKFSEYATRDIAQLKKWFPNNYNNAGVVSQKFADNGESLAIVDIDRHGSVNGFDSLEILKDLGHEFPETFSVKTPSNGLHLYYRTRAPLRRGAKAICKGIDLPRYVVAPGSEINGKFYEIVDDLPIAEFSESLADFAKPRERKAAVQNPRAEISEEGAKRQAIEYLKSVKPARQYEGGDEYTYKVACMVRDMGVDEASCIDLMLEYFYPRCEPNNKPNFIERKVGNAYMYAKLPSGNKAPEMQFEPVVEQKSANDDSNDDPILKYNQHHAVIKVGQKAQVLWEKRNDLFKPAEFINVDDFCILYKNDRMLNASGKVVETAREWIKHSKRRTFDSITFLPGKKTSPGEYNLWRGFTEKPLAKDESPSQQMVDGVEAFKEHLFENVSQKDQFLCDWITGFFAHLMQKPWEKPIVAPVFRGEQGTGKDTVANIIGHYVFRHYVMVDKMRFLTGSFNSYLLENLFTVFNEAFWSGNKQAEGTLRNLVTGTHHLIELKGKEPFTVPNLSRVLIMGNEDWLVPAAFDDRRFAVYDIGNGRKRDTKFFYAMRTNLEAGGYRLLLRYLLDFDLSIVRLDDAPKTKGLIDQKTASFDPVQQFWDASLKEGRMVGSSDSDWQEEYLCDRLHDLYVRFSKSMGFRYTLNPVRFGLRLKRACTELKRIRRRHEGDRSYLYEFPSLEECRLQWQDINSFDDTYWND